MKWDHRLIWLRHWPVTSKIGGSSPPGPELFLGGYNE